MTSCNMPDFNKLFDEITSDEITSLFSLAVYQIEKDIQQLPSIFGFNSFVFNILLV